MPAVAAGASMSVICKIAVSVRLLLLPSSLNLPELLRLECRLLGRFAELLDRDFSNRLLLPVLS